MKKFLIIGAEVTLSSLYTQKLKEEFGEDVKIYTPEQAKLEGLNDNDFDNLPTLKINNTFNKKYLYAPKSKVGKGGRARNRSQIKNNFHK